MTSRDFCYWLQGFFELRDAEPVSEGLSAQQTELLRKHLALVFKHEIDPSAGPPALQEKLQEIHDSTPHGIRPSGDIRFTC